MTLPELCDYSENADNTMPPDGSPNPAQIGHALQALLQQAASQGRVTCSLTSCVDVLSTRPDDVMLCVMPLLSHPDAAATIQSTLIRAVCQEHCIRVLSVDCDVKLAKVVCLSGSGDGPDHHPQGGCSGGGGGMDANCNAVLLDNAGCCQEGMIISGCDNVAPVMGFPCVLVQYPQDKASQEEELIAEYCKEQLYGDNGKEPYIELPD